MCECAYLRWPTHRRYEAVTDWLCTFSSVQSRWSSFFRKKFNIVRCVVPWMSWRPAKTRAKKISKKKFAKQMENKKKLFYCRHYDVARRSQSAQAQAHLPHTIGLKQPKLTVEMHVDVSRRLRVLPGVTCDTERVWRTSSDVQRDSFLGLSSLGVYDEHGRFEWIMNRICCVIAD